MSWWVADLDTTKTREKTGRGGGLDEVTNIVGWGLGGVGNSQP